VLVAVEVEVVAAYQAALAALVVALAFMELEQTALVALLMVMLVLAAAEANLFLPEARLGFMQTHIQNQ
jgi:hypothetical protein